MGWKGAGLARVCAGDKSVGVQIEVRDTAIKVFVYTAYANTAGASMKAVAERLRDEINGRHLSKAEVLRMRADLQ